jgi:hypothetical protein
MRYLHFQITAGTEHIVVVTINEKTDYKNAIIRLLDTGSYYKYRLGKPCEAKLTQNGAPKVVIEPPYSGTWHVIIEPSAGGEIKAFVDVKKKGT